MIQIDSNNAKCCQSMYLDIASLALVLTAVVSHSSKSYILHKLLEFFITGNKVCLTIHLKEQTYMEIHNISNIPSIFEWCNDILK